MDIEGAHTSLLRAVRDFPRPLSRALGPRADEPPTRPQRRRLIRLGASLDGSLVKLQY